jgi:hypothetical protein
MPLCPFLSKRNYRYYLLFDYLRDDSIQAKYHLRHMVVKHFVGCVTLSVLVGLSER